MSSARPASAATEITFILSNLPDLETLLAGLPAGSEVHVLDANGDALAEMAGILEGRSGIDAIHLMSHGAPGSLQLGQTSLSNATLGQHGAQLAAIGASLSDDADLLIYGCNVAAGETGLAFVQALGDATGADVAASVDLTGSAASDGNWILETHAGAIETDALTLENVDGVLASGIFNNGYIKFGYSDDGTFGYGSNTTPGIFYDSTGAFNFPANADFLTPGTPREFFTLQSSGGTWTNKNDSYTSPQLATTRTESITTSGGKTYGTLTFTSTAGGLELKQTITLGANSQVITIDVSVRNTTASTISNVKYARGIDPDVDSPLGTTNTINARGADGIAATDIVLGTGPLSGRVIGLYTNSSVTHNTNISSGWSVDPSALLGASSNSTADSTINLAFDLGSLGAGVTKSFSFAYVYAANATALNASITEVPPSNPAPTFTSFAAPFGAVLEDNQIEITYAQLAAQGNEADLNANGSAGTISAFVIKAVSSGTLKIGADAGSATAWSPNSNDTIPSDGSKKLYWTPAANANGTLNAFTAIVKDAEGAVSASPVQATVTVTAVNDNPVIASHATPVTLPAINEDASSIGGATVTSLFAPRFTDVDSGASLGGIIVVANTNAAGGAWQYSTDNGTYWYDIDTVSDASGLALSASSKLRFNPEANWNGTPTPLSVYLTDNTYSGGYTSGATRDTEASLSAAGISTNSVNLGTTVNSVNDLPVFTSAAGAASFTETAAYDNSVTTASGSLSGTLAGNDVEDGTALTFGIRGGSTTGATVTKKGFYGTLTLDTGTKEWTYTPDNFVAINALREGQTATDVFEFSATDSAGATAIQALTLTYTGTNDTPLLAAAIADTDFNGNGAWSFQIPANTFTDAEGTNLTYTVEIVDGAVLDTITGVMGDDASKPSNWMIFDQPSRTLSGTPTTTAPLPLNIKVTASDGSASVSDTFTVTLNPPPSGAGVQPDAAYTENAAAVTLNPGLDLSSSSIVPSNMSTVTVTISAGKTDDDSLAFNNTNGTTFGNILGAYASETGILTLQSDSNSATLEQWSAALNAVTFHSGSDNPGASRTLAWVITDGTNNANTSTTITVTEVNDAPVATALPDVTVTAGDPLNLDIDNIFTDPEGDTVAYSAQYQKADGTWAAVPASGDSFWLNFDSDTHIFSGNPPAGLPYLKIKVIGTDTQDQAAEGFTTFTLNLTNPGSAAVAANNDGTVSISGTATLGSTLTAAAPVDADGYTGTVVYRWQSKASSGDWVDISGARGGSSTLTITQAESSKQVRVQAFYNDAGGFAEAPVSNAIAVPTLNVAGTVGIAGAVTPGQTLVATLSDANGLSGATPTYTWYRGNTAGAETTVVGGNYSAYTLTNDDGGKFIRVKVTYTDDEGTAETAAVNSAQVQLGAVAPVAVNDTASATEASGLANATAGSNGSGNLLTNDTDANSGDTKAVSALRTGNTAGLGDIAEDDGTTLTLVGQYGTLTVTKASGAYTYVINENSLAVQALNSGGTLHDYFNYNVADATALSDIGVLDVTINGANDKPSVFSAPASFSAVEDAATALVFSSEFNLDDVDNAGAVTVKLQASEGKLSGASSGDVTVTGNDSGTLTLSGTFEKINAWLKTADKVSYTSSPNDNGTGTATIALIANDGTGDLTLATINVDVTAANDAPRLDLNADNSTAAGVVVGSATGADLTGNDHAVVFRPRGAAVQVVDDDVTITDVDGDTTLVKATVEITAGAWDNSRTIYETLSSTAGGSIGGIVITGNGTGTGGLSGATKLTLTGTATHAQYQDALKTIVYNNSNENAFAGNRSITINVFDKETADGGLESNSGSFTTSAVNNSIAVGQKIYIGGSDTGQTVATVIDSTHFVASGPLTGMAHNAAMSFWLNGAQVTTATATAPLFATGYAAAAATTTVQVLWTPVVDLNGNTASGVSYTTSYTEGSAGTYITSTDALITDQDGNLKTVTVTLENAADTFEGNSTETLFMAANIVSNLTTNGITTTFYDASNNVVANGAAGAHKIVFSGNKDATTFQLGMREVQYKNTSENPGVTPRTVKVEIVDQDDNSGVSATATINIIPVNDAPVKGGDFAAELDEGAVYVFTTGDLNSTDVDNDNGTLKYILTSTPAQGTLFRDSNGNGVVDDGEAIATVGASASVANINAIGSNGYFTQAEVAAGQIKYAHNGQNPNGTNASGTTTFGVKVVDGMEDYAFGSIPADTVTLTITEVNDPATGAPVISGAMTPGEILTVNVSDIADPDGPEAPVFTYQWQVSENGTDWANATGTGNATGSYTLAAADQGKQVKVVVSFNDALGRANNLTGAASGTVAYTNTAPGGSVSITDDGTPQPGETLSADTSLLTDSDGLGPFSYQWAVSSDGAAWTPVAGATGATYTLPGNATTGNHYKLIVSYTDGRGNSETVDSSAITVQAAAAAPNVAPSLTGLGAFPAVASLFSGVAVSTVENGQNIKTLTLTVSGIMDGSAEKITIDGVAIDLAAAGVTAVVGGAIDGVSYEIAMAGSNPDTATVTLTHVGLTEAQTKTLVEGLSFTNVADTPTAGLRVVTLTSLQDNGGGADTGSIGVSATEDVGGSLPGSNTAPVVTTGGIFNTATVAEGGVVAIANGELAASDTEQTGLTVVLASTPTNGTLFRDLNGNGRVDGAETALVAGSTFALADITAGRIKYLHDGSETTTAGFTFNVSDGLALSDADGGIAGNQPHTFTITVNPVDDAPTLSATALGSNATPVAFAEGDAAVAVFSGANASPVESDENITGITVMVGGLRDGSAEKLVIDGTAIALTDGTNGTTTGANTVVYTVSVTGGTASVTLTKDLSAATWNTLIDGLKYENTSENPTNGNRVLTLTGVTETGGQSTTASISSHVAVTAANDAPTLTLNAITVAEGGSKTLSTGDIVAADVDTPLSSLLYTLSAAPAQGWLYLDANGNGVRDGGETLAADATFTHAQLVGGKLRYQHNDGELADSFKVQVNDGQGGASVEQTMTVTRTAVNDAPAIAGLGADVLAYPANSGARTLEQGGDALVSDPDSANFNGGNLRVSITFNRDPANDVLSIANVGTDAGQIGVAEANVSYAGTAIGTFTGGSGTSDLVVSFNANATHEAATALIKAIQFSNSQANPTHTSRTVSFALYDGAAGGQAAPVAVNVNIATGVTPSISIANGFFVVENSQLVTALSATDPASRPITFSVSGTVDATNNPDSGEFEIVSGNLLRFVAAPDFEIPTDSGTNNVYNVIIRATNDLGSYAEQALSVTVLDQEPEGGIVPGDTAGPVFGFATVNGTTLTMQYTDAGNLDATNIPPTSAFTVSGNTVTAVAVNAAAKTVTLTLGTAVAYGQSVTVAYADPAGGNDANAIQDANGNDAATLAATAVSNLATAPAGSGGGGGSGGSSGGGGSGGGGTTTVPMPGGGTTTTSTAPLPGGGSTSTTTTTRPSGETTTSTTTTQGGTTVTETTTTGGGTTVRETTTTQGGTTSTITTIEPVGTGGGSGGTGNSGTPVTVALVSTGGNGSGAGGTAEALLSATLPQDVGLTAEVMSSSGQTLRQQLIAASNPRIHNDPAFREVVDEGIDRYVPTVADQSQVTVRTLTLTAGSGLRGAPASPIVINGALGTGEDNTVHPHRQEALVIDARALPSGSVLQLGNVEFAIVVGAIRVLGGAGRNFVVGDEADQFIVLGEGDDVLRGGGGDDTVGSEGGNDQLYGDDGNDTLFGGQGNDTLDGGSGTDTAQFSGKLSEYNIRHTEGNLVIVSDRQAGRDGVDTVRDCEWFDFGGVVYRVDQLQSIDNSGTSIFLPAGHGFNAFNQLRIYGHAGQETVRLQTGSNIEIDQNVDRVELVGSLADYSFAQAGNSLQISRGGGLMATLTVQYDADGSTLVCADGQVVLKLVAATMYLGNQPLTATPVTLSAGMLGSSLNIDDKTSGQGEFASNPQDIPIFLGMDESVTVLDRSAIYGNQGTEILQIARGASQIVVDQNIERIEFGAVLANYAFQQQGNQMLVFQDSAKVATISVQDNAGTQLVFGDGAVQARLSANGALMLGNQTVSAATHSQLTSGQLGSSLDATDTASLPAAAQEGHTLALLVGVSSIEIAFP